MKYREHRGSLGESLETTVELDNTLEALANHLKVPVEELEIVPYGVDERIGWDTYLVTNSEGVLGMIDTKL